LAKLALLGDQLHRSLEWVEPAMVQILPLRLTHVWPASQKPKPQVRPPDEPVAAGCGCTRAPLRFALAAAGSARATRSAAVSKILYIIVHSQLTSQVCGSSEELRRPVALPHSTRDSGVLSTELLVATIFRRVDDPARMAGMTSLALGYGPFLRVFNCVRGIRVGK
jgi:hypothetical protein